MPEPTAPEGDFDLDNVPPDPPVHHAEQALLGALLLDPHRLKTIGPLAPGHFASPAHGAVFAAMTGLTPPAPAAHIREPVWLTAVHDRAREQTPGLVPAYLHTLVSVCPVPEHAPAYARMVRADHARRTLRIRAEHLVQTTTEPTMPDPAATALAGADALAGFLDHLAGQFPPHPGSLPRSPPPPPPERNGRDEAAYEERVLLAGAVAHPEVLSRMRWLHADDFTVPLHGSLFRCVAQLAHRGAAVDPVTVLWEAQHHGLLLPPLTPREVLDLVTAPAGAAEHWGERVLRRSLLHQARTAGLRIHAYTDDPANSVHQLVTGSRRALADLTAVRTRWHHQHSAPQPPARRQAPENTLAARAGPLRTTAPAGTARTTR
ncbi:DnaB-like helicase N-terminal domain-containing protein [Streptomyces sp. NPDC014894]|uniref:DnaB-like helicase N-terminal domain-containing protein n=1 Tax=Streptomyces sp. NPDC014894 TaxID=3364931 RepID=UPI0036FB57E6